MTIHDHIAELRAELAGSLLTRAERRQIEAELAEALAHAATIGADAIEDMAA